MSDVPFGFSDPDDDPKRREGGSGEGGSGGGAGPGGPAGFGAPGFGAPGFGAGGFNPEGFGSAGFDPAALGQMLTQFGQMLSGMGSGGTGFGGGTSQGPVNYELAKRLAKEQIGSITAVRAGESEAIADAVHLAELWLDAVTTLPAGVTKTAAWTPIDWLDNTIDTWKRLCDPVAEQISGVWVNGLPAEAKEMAGPMLAMVSQMGGMAFGSQLGQGLGQLAKEVLTSTDIGLPLGPAGVAALLPQSVARFAEGLDRPHREVVVFLAAREAAHHRLYSHIPWLRQRLLATVEEYARGIKIDFSAIEEAAQGFDLQSLADPSAMEKILGQGAFEPQTTPEQKLALERLETLLALIEGWVEIVVSQALGDRLPGVGALSETLRRRRATGGPAEQTFATLVGLELRPRRVREAALLWTRLGEAGGMESRDRVWGHPDLLPDSADLDNPSAFIDRVIGAGTSQFDDPMAELEKTIAREQAEAAADATDDKGSGDKGSGDKGSGDKGSGDKGDEGTS